MKLFTSDQIRAIEQTSIAEGCYSSLELMDRAASAFVSWFKTKVSTDCAVSVFCGNGNNGADGLVIGDKLVQYGYRVRIFVVDKSGGSREFAFHLNRLEKNLSFSIEKYQANKTFRFEPSEVIIDALLGSGLNRPAGPPYSDILELINSSKKRVYAVDIPSGLPGEGLSIGPTVRATATYSFEFPRLTFFSKEGRAVCGEWTFRTIGLSRKHIQGTPSGFHLITNRFVSEFFNPRQPYAHKGNFGHVHLFAGTTGMAGAGILSGRATLRSGAGLCSVTSSADNRVVFQTAAPEIMVNGTMEEMQAIDLVSKTVAIGPGLGTDPVSEQLLRHVLKTVDRPMVIDADAINLLSMHRELIDQVPDKSILTPHPGEFKRLVGDYSDSIQRMKKQVEFAREKNLIVVLKDHNTIITTPDNQVYYNATGNPGMATGGSGDVLTGVIAGLLAQWADPVKASLAGVYLHGLAGDLAMCQKGEMAMTAGDIIEMLPLSIMKLSNAS